MAGEWDKQAAEIGEVPRTWEVALLCDFTTRITYGFTNPMPTTDSGPYMVTAKDVTNGRINYATARHTSSDAYQNALTDKSRPRIGDVLLTKDGSIGRVAVCDRSDICINQSVALLQPDHGKIDYRFLRFLLECPHYQRRMEGDADGTTIKHIYITRVDKMQVAVPPLPEQKRIAHILGTLDDKIDLNRRMNATLEAMSRAIFKAWFVDFDPVRQKAEGKQPVGMDAKTAALFPDSFEDSEIGEVPKGWRTCVLDDFTADVIGGDWGESEPTDLATTPCRCVRGADIPSLQEGGVGKMPLRYLKPSSVGKRQLNAGDIAVEISGGSPTQSTGRPVLVTAGLLNRLDHALVASNFCRIVKLQHPSASQFLYLYLRHLYDEDTFLQYENGTTGIKNFAYTLFASRHPLLAPDDRVIDAFASKTTSLSESAQHKAKESEVLAAFRDTLLPKLLSGELRIPEAEQAVEEANT